MNRRRWALGAVAAAGVVLGGHAIVARFAGCPIRQPTVGELETQRVAAMRSLAKDGADAAPSLAVGTLVLGTTPRVEVVAHLGADATCREELGGASVTCTGARAETVARFDPEGRLVGLDRSQERSTAEEAGRDLDARFAARSGLGAPERRWGEATAAYLDRPLRQAGASWRFRDLAVDVTATHLAGGVVVREQHRLLGPGSG